MEKELYSVNVFGLNHADLDHYLEIAEKIVELKPSFVLIEGADESVNLSLYKEATIGEIAKKYGISDEELLFLTPPEDFSKIETEPWKTVHTLDDVLHTPLYFMSTDSLKFVIERLLQFRYQITSEKFVEFKKEVLSKIERYSSYIKKLLNDGDYLEAILGYMELYRATAIVGAKVYNMDDEELVKEAVELVKKQYREMRHIDTHSEEFKQLNEEREKAVIDKINYYRRKGKVVVVCGANHARSFEKKISDAKVTIYTSEKVTRRMITEHLGSLGIEVDSLEEEMGFLSEVWKKGRRKDG